MIYDNKIYEPKKRKALRYSKNLIVFLFLLFVLFSIACVVFIRVSNIETVGASEAFFGKRPDAIIVFTGDLGRIPFALKKALEFGQPNIFITGVYSSNTVNTLLDPLKIKEKIDSTHLEIDYLAQNTVENAISTIRYLRKNKGMNKILIISSDYHIMRIKLIIDTIKTSIDNYQIFYTGIKTDYFNFRNIKIIYKEVYKYIRTFFFLLLWEDETAKKIEH